MTGLGFIPGAYRCLCADGYYFPQTDIPTEEKYYPGSELEQYVAEINSTTNSTKKDPMWYKCLPCAEVRKILQIV